MAVDDPMLFETFRQICEYTSQRVVFLLQGINVTYLVPTMRSKKFRIGMPAGSCLSIALSTSSSTIPRIPPLILSVLSRRADKFQQDLTRRDTGLLRPQA